MFCIIQLAADVIVIGCFGGVKFVKSLGVV